MDLSVLGDLVNGAWTLAKEVGKGGGGSTEEPTVCITLLPFAIGFGVVAWQSLRRRLRGGGPATSASAS
jgi:hypothetical protein